jgi:hypothetical protein
MYLIKVLQNNQELFGKFVKENFFPKFVSEYLSQLLSQTICSKLPSGKEYSYKNLIFAYNDTSTLKLHTAIKR